ncbi:aerobic-type carbon monoxide dehydrogenase, CoxG accessory protein [Burkholderiales bacterium]|nr:aerobic-type carbon monoxide dehydrogenase, CoxG accessory protein [Burkholderiales bacterium]
MKVQLQQSYPMPASAEIVWGFLQNIEAVAGCMPGAKITERVDDQHYKGTVTVRAGPATMSFRGQVEVKDIDGATRTLRLLGKGTDTTGTSGASMDLTARVESAGTASNLVGTSEVTMSGKAAAFGGRVMNAVADEVLKQFAGNFAAQVAALAAAPGSSASPGGGAAPPPGAAGTSAAGAQTLPPPARELNGLALLWAVVRNWLRSLFGKSPA